MTKIYFRAEGNKKIGLGHVIRSLALADILKCHFECHFIIAAPSDSMRSDILNVCVSILDLPPFNNSTDEAVFIQEQYLSHRDICVLDGYNFTTDYQKKIKVSGCKLVSIDDIYNCHFISDIIINHAPISDPSVYSTEEYTKIYTGLKYALLRRPFLKFIKKKSNTYHISKIFICLGGSDLKNITQRILEKLVDIRSNTHELNVVLGSANIWSDQITALNQVAHKANIVIHRNLSALKMRELMLSCDLAIVPASSILYEVSKLNIPTISGFYVDNQLDVYKGYKALGLIYPIGDLNEYHNYEKALMDIEKGCFLKLMSSQVKHLDINSEGNLIDLFLQIDPSVNCRTAAMSDLMTYYNWANDSSVRINSINTAEISLSGHKDWFKSKMSDGQSVMYLIERDNEDIGQVRFDRDKKKIMIDYSVALEHRGKRMGKLLLKVALEKYIEEVKLPKGCYFIGVVKTSNIASKKVFQSLGFNLMENFEKSDQNDFSTFTKMKQ